MTLISPTKDNLTKNLHPEWIHSRMGPGGKKLFYLNSYAALKLANEMFGRDGWKREIKSVVEDFCEVAEDGKVTVAMAAIVRVTLLKHGTFHEDTGYAIGEHEHSKEVATDRARLAAGFDGMKRALRKFGNVMGNCLYNTTYLHHVEPAVQPQPAPLPFTKQQQQQQQQQQQRPPNQQQQRPPLKPPAPVTLGKRARYDEQQLPNSSIPPLATRIKNEQTATATTTVATIPPCHSSSNIKKEPITAINKYPPPLPLPSSSHAAAAAAGTTIIQPTPLSSTTGRKTYLDATTSRLPTSPITTTTTTTTTGSLPSTTDTNRPTLCKQDSFALDEQDEALLASITDAQLDIKLLQRTCGENIHPPTKKSWLKITKSPSHQ